MVVRRLVLAVVALVALAGTSLQAAPLVDGTPMCGEEGDGPVARVQRKGQLRVGSFNILHAQSEEDESNVTKRLPQVLDAMQAADAHVWGLQEVTSNTEHGRVAQLIAQGLAERTGRTWSWCWFLSNPHVPGEPDTAVGGGGPLSDQMAAMASFPEAGDFREGLAIVTSLDLTEARSRRLAPRTYEAPLCVPPDPFACNFAAAFDSRQVLWARVDAGPAGGLDLFTTHLAHGLTALSDTTKRIQVEQALMTIDEWSTPDALPDLFVGDFNSTSADDRYATVIDSGFVDTYLAAGGRECDPTTHTGCTSSQREVTDEPVPTTTSRIDFVFARPGACGLRSTGAQIIGTNAVQQPSGQWLWPSDHLGLVTGLRCG
jgi:endonuclease/exonuclease/phosphatase family metal-dependent hydrolase